MKNVSFPERSFHFREVIRGIAILAIVLTWVFTRTANAGAWEYKAPFTVSGVAGTGGVVTGGATASGQQLFRESLVYTVSPYIPPAQPASPSNSWLPFAMMGLAMAPMLFADAPSSKTPRRTPAGNPPLGAGGQAQPRYAPAGAH